MLKKTAVYSTKCSAIARAKWRVLSNYKHDVCNCPINAQIRLLIANHVREFCYSFDYLQKRAVRAVANSDYRAHTAPLFSKLKILDIFQINTLDIAKFMFRYHNNLLPPLFLNLFMTNSQVHRYDTRTAGNYCAHSCRTNIKKFTILYQGPGTLFILQLPICQAFLPLRTKC